MRTPDDTASPESATEVADDQPESAGGIDVTDPSVSYRMPRTARDAFDAVAARHPRENGRCYRSDVLRPLAVAATAEGRLQRIDALPTTHRSLTDRIAAVLDAGLEVMERAGRPGSTGKP